MQKKIKIAPSILSADFLRLGDEIDSVISAGAELIHFDVMDGDFVPNISVGVPVLQSVARMFKGKAVLDVHLMISKPWRFAAKFAELGADVVSIHLEAGSEPDIHRTLDEIRHTGAVAGLVLKPATPATAVLPHLERIGVVTVMTVEPGFGGQAFMADQLAKIRELRELLPLETDLEVDGGINLDTAKLCVEAGANILVAGNSVFGAVSRSALISALQKVCK